jgi:hypothetical protein
MRRMAILLALFASTTLLIISAYTMVQAAPLGEVMAQTTRQETVTKERVIIRETTPVPPSEPEIIVRQAPPLPPPREEVRIAPPSQTHVWIPGHWTWNNQWVWSPGRWETPPERTVTWVPGEWVQRGSELVWRPGHWR